MLRRLFPVPLRRLLRSWLDKPAVKRARRLAMRPIPKDRPSHGLDGELIVSLTSYPARFPQLHLTLRSLLHQSIRPDRLILWIAEEDRGQLTPETRALEKDGLEIATCPDLRSFKKLVPSLARFPNAYVVTADDDLYYRSDWLSTLVDEVEPGERVVMCHRAHRLINDAAGLVRPYRERQSDVHDQAARTNSHDLVATTGAGALFPPASLHPVVLDQEKFLRICPHGDDLWFAWCAALAGTPVRKVGARFRVLNWPGTTDDSLWSQNEAGGNDRMIEALQQEFGPGWPPSPLPVTKSDVPIA